LREKVGGGMARRRGGFLGWLGFGGIRKCRTLILIGEGVSGRTMTNRIISHRVYS